MREIVLQRIDEIKSKQNGFPRDLRWGTFFFKVTHISEVDYHKLDDESLALFFELLLIRLYGKI